MSFSLPFQNYQFGARASSYQPKLPVHVATARLIRKSTRSWTALLLTAAFLAFFRIADAQQAQFDFDADGNLVTQTAESGAPPQIIAQPQQQVVVPGELASFCVVVADPTGLTYQWRFNGVDISGATGDILLLTGVTTNDEGSYSVVLVNGSGSV